MRFTSAGSGTDVHNNFFMNLINIPHFSVDLIWYFNHDLKYHSLTFKKQIILESFSEFGVMVLLRIKGQHKVYFPDSISKVHSLMLWSEERRLMSSSFDLRTEWMSAFRISGASIRIDPLIYLIVNSRAWNNYNMTWTLFCHPFTLCQTKGFWSQRKIVATIFLHVNILIIVCKPL